MRSPSSAPLCLELLLTFSLEPCPAGDDVRSGSRPLQHDMWGVKPPGDRFDWDALRADIATHGVRNSLLVAPMPTASTSQVSPQFEGSGSGISRGSGHKSQPTPRV